MHIPNSQAVKVSTVLLIDIGMEVALSLCFNRGNNVVGYGKETLKTCLLLAFYKSTRRWGKLILVFECTIKNRRTHMASYLNTVR